MERRWRLSHLPRTLSGEHRTCRGPPRGASTPEPITRTPVSSLRRRGGLWCHHHHLLHHPHTNWLVMSRRETVYWVNIRTGQVNRTGENLEIWSANEVKQKNHRGHLVEGTQTTRPYKTIIQIQPRLNHQNVCLYVIVMPSIFSCFPSPQWFVLVKGALGWKIFPRGRTILRMAIC